MKNNAKNNVSLHPFVSENMTALMRKYTEYRTEGNNDECVLIPSCGVTDTEKITVGEAGNIIAESFYSFIHRWYGKIPPKEREDFVQEAICAFFGSSLKYMFNYCHFAERAHDPWKRAGYMKVFFSSMIYDFYKKIEKEVYVINPETGEFYTDSDGDKIKRGVVSIDDSDSDNHEEIMAEIEKCFEENNEECDLFDDEKHFILVESLRTMFSKITGRPDKVLLGVYKLAIMAISKSCNGGLNDFDRNGLLKRGALYYINDRTPREIVFRFSSEYYDISDGTIVFTPHEVAYIFTDFMHRLDEVDAKTGIMLGDIKSNYDSKNGTNDSHRIMRRKDKIFDEKVIKNIHENHYNGEDPTELDNTTKENNSPNNKTR